MSVVFLIFGLFIGSFINMLAYRIPNGIQTTKGRSFCPQCKNTIKPYDLIPVFSYIFLKGKCRSCHAKIPFTYFLTELATGFLFAVTYLVIGLNVNLFIYLVVITSFITITKIDYKEQYIPDRLVITILLMSVIYVIYNGITNDLDVIEHIIGAFLGFFIFFIIRQIGYLIYKKESLGFGDVKLLGVIGLLVGYKQVLLIIMLSCILASIIELTLIALKVKKRDEPFAFGPYIIYASIVAIFFGQIIIDAYTNFIWG